MDIRDQFAEYQIIRAFIKPPSNPRAKLNRKLYDAMMDDLTERQRKMTDMYYMRQMTMMDIAQETGVCVSTVSRTIKRAKRHIEKYMRFYAMAADWIQAAD